MITPGTLPAERSVRSPLRAHLYLTTSLVAILLLVGCGSSGLGDILGGGSDPAEERIAEVSGTVRYVDTANRSIELERVDHRYGLQNSDERSRIYYDADTVVEYQGQTYRPEALEPGDEIVARVDDTGRDLIAQTIDVTYDTSRGTGDRYDDRYEPSNDPYREGTVADLRGTVRYVDTRDNTIELERIAYARRFDRDPSGDRLVLEYSPDTRVEFQGQLYGPENLEVGDEVAVEVRQVGSRYVVEEIEVIRDVRSR